MGHAEGHAEGHAQGQLEVLVKQVCKKRRKGLVIEEVAEQLEVEIEDIWQIYNVAEKYAPDYDAESVLKELCFKA